MSGPGAKPVARSSASAAQAMRVAAFFTPVSFRCAVWQQEQQAPQQDEEQIPGEQKLGAWGPEAQEVVVVSGEDLGRQEAGRQEDRRDGEARGAAALRGTRGRSQTTYCGERTLEPSMNASISAAAYRGNALKPPRR